MAYIWDEKDREIQKILKEETEMPSVVMEKVQETFQMIKKGETEKDQKRTQRTKEHWRKTAVKFAGGAAAILAAGVLFCAANPVMAKNLPLIGRLFERLQDQVSFYGNFSDEAESLTVAESEDKKEKNAESESSLGTGSNSFEAVNDGLTITLSEIYANDQAVYITMMAKSDEPFPETMMVKNESDTEHPYIGMDIKKTYSFDENENDSYINDSLSPEGTFLDEYTYACILRFDLSEEREDHTEYLEKYNEMCEQILKEMGISLKDIDSSTEEGQALLNEFDRKIQERKGSLEIYKKERNLPDEFSLHLDIRNFVGEKAEPEEWDSGYTSEELQEMTCEQIQEIYAQRPDEYMEYPNKYSHYWFEGTWSFDIPVHIDRSRTETIEVNEVGDSGVGLKSVVKTPYELMFNEMYSEGADTDVFLVALDADGNKLPNNSSNTICNNFTIQDRDITMVDVYILDYIQYMDELKGEEYYNNNENKPEEEKWGTLLEKYAKYHKTLHFD